MGNFTYNNTYWSASKYQDVKSNQFPVIVDIITTTSILPEAIVKEYAKQVSRPVRRAQGFYWAHCDAKLPKFGVVIGGKTFYFNDNDLLLKDTTQEFSENGRYVEYCCLGLTDNAPSGPFFLGSTFLNSVVSMFDVGASEMRFYAKR
jgi:hypothetical protein